MSPAASDAAFDSWFSTSPLMSILRGLDAETTVRTAHRAWDLGFALVEIPLSDTTASHALSQVVAAASQRDQVVGAGTVTSVAAAEEAHGLGAAFTVAPGWDPVVAQASLRLGMPHLPGVMSPGDVQQARSAGHRWVKLFPASVVGPEMISALHGPFPGLRIVATGGVDGDNARTFLAAGAGAVSLSGATRTISAEHVRTLTTARRAAD
ncbi:bifunctional 4-hydroxy-2-oxoglutarate aldolase/2-dehydro-3-deoxy-phosphogluconate aldolase [Isoptericola sp. BMS4]|uniref:bifunctional 4-hydroxy-2-oxoglutarate aldolase/2-dehydro-3-deoxy-phosphogluconate aldolase n=1 Tax=Isoptericola sp. BMS4 TaxID=2527875 RepID=UPI0021082FA2|nr:bifunctional 4-hydroxy-2-oxoglutarate aldolase/2-dehydro-3-deoxy-phosphogluconate aldolase [Isoptericola sp. BMS4]